LNLRYFNSNVKLKTIFELLGVINYSFPLAMLFVFNLFSLLGLPPFAGFFGKFYLFFSAIGSEFFFFLYLSILGSIFSAVIYLRMIRLIIFNKYNNVVFYKLVDSTSSLIISV